MQLGHLLSAGPEYQLSGDPTVDIAALAWDSRRVQPGGMFVAYRGVAVDGHDFIDAAAANGAACIVGEHKVEAARCRLQSTHANVAYARVPDGREALAWMSAAWHGFPARRLAMVGVTGTDGKTTTVNLIYHILRAAGRRVGMVSTVSALFEGKAVDTGLHTTTPDAFDVQRLLAGMVAAGIRTCVLETTSHGLAQHRVTACEFDMAVVTNITHEHLDAHGSLDAYRAAKAMLFAGLMTGARKPGVPKVAVLNRGDNSYDCLRIHPADLTITYNADGPADVTARDVRYAPDGTRLVVCSSHGEFETKTRLVGRFNLSNILAATATALALGATPSDVQRGLGTFPGVPGRMERVDRGQPFTAMVDFAHTPNSLRQALLAGRQLAAPGGHVIVVFGCAGRRDVQKRRLMGCAAAQMADYAVLTAEDPRTEELGAIIEAIAEGCRQGGGVEGSTYEHVPDRGSAIARGVELARPGDVLLVCGKGHEQSMCFGDVEYPWDDRAALAAVLGGCPTDILPATRTQTAKGGPESP